MKAFFDFFPILLFFVAYKFAGIYVATGAAIATSLLQLGWTWFRTRKLEKMQLATLVLLLVSGGLTLGLRDQIFIMWKPSLVNWLFAAAFLGSQWVGDRTLVERMYGQFIDMPRGHWNRLNLSWVLFFALIGLANLFIVYRPGGFFEAREALTALAGRTDIDLDECARDFVGEVLQLCSNAKKEEEFWVNFKLFGFTGLTFVFVFLQMIFLRRYLIEPEPKEA